MSDEHEIRGLMETAMSNLREMVDVSTIIGDVIESECGVSVVPVSRVTCGFVAGGGDIGRMRDREKTPFAGGSGAGVCVQPVGFLVMCGDQVRLIPVCGATPLDKAIEAIPVLTENLKGIMGHKCCDC